ncbi:MAG: aminotransferase class IV [Pseudomonadota bacterium]
MQAVIQELISLAEKGRVFVSMPWVPGLTPEALGREGLYEVAETDERVERRHGILRLDQAGLSPLDHGGLYGDAVFEGILVNHGQIFLFKEHMDRWWRSAGKLDIAMPYSKEELSWQILRTVQAVGFADDERGYLRPVLSRGFGNLGINPAKCLAPTVYCIVSTIQLYPPATYETGIEVSVARRIRRAGAEIEDPNVKSNNYLNNISGLLETRSKGRLETLMLTGRGNVAEATADNVFLVKKEAGWEADPSKVALHTPVGDYCLVGITRGRIIEIARAKGFAVVERDDLLPIDFVVPASESFMTGTGCGLMPVVGVEGVPVGDGTPGPVTRALLEAIQADMRNPESGLSIHADRAELARYIAD